MVKRIILKNSEEAEKYLMERQRYLSFDKYHSRKLLEFYSKGWRSQYFNDDKRFIANCILDPNVVDYHSTKKKYIDIFGKNPDPWHIFDLMHYITNGCGKLSNKKFSHKKPMELFPIHDYCVSKRYKTTRKEGNTRNIFKHFAVMFLILKNGDLPRVGNIDSWAEKYGVGRGFYYLFPRRMKLRYPANDKCILRFTVPEGTPEEEIELFPYAGAKCRVVE